MVNTVFKGKLFASTHLQPEPSQSTGLLDFPNEILLFILEQVELDWDLFTLASISRRLHYLALPLFFARNGVSPFAGELILFDARSYAVFRALSIALFKPSLKQLRCTFDFAKPENIRRLGKLVANLSRIEEVFVNFMDTTYREPGFKPVKPLEFGPVAATELSEVFSAIMRKSGRITIYDTSVWYAGSTAKELAAIGRKQFSKYMLKSMTSTVWDVARSIGSWLARGTGSDAPPVSSLSIDLYCSMLFHASFFPWTLRALNSTRLSTLSLRQLNMKHDKWEAILPPLIMPNLRNLTVESCSIPFLTLIKLLSRHPQITNLYLGRNLAPPSQSDPLPVGVLPRLTHISATSQYLLYFLAPKTSLAILKSVSMIIRIQHGCYFDFRALNDTLLPISLRLKQIEFSLEISFVSSSDDWMLPDVAPDQRLEATMRHVTKIDLKLAMYRLPRDIIASLPRWLMLFPRLKCVSLLTLTREWPMDLVERTTFIRSIHAKCPWIEIVGMNDFVHSVEVWLEFFR